MKFKLAIFLLAGLIILALPLMSGLTFQQDKNINMVVPCTLDGYPCSDSGTCNLTILYPNSTYLINDQVMTNQENGDFNYSVLFPDAGTYVREVNCQDLGKNGTAETVVTINEGGEEITESQARVYSIALIILVILFGLTLFGAITLPFGNKRDNEGFVIRVSDLKFLKVFLYAASYLLLMFIFGLTRSVTANFLFLNGISKAFNLLYWFMFSFLWPLMVAGLTFTVVVFLQGRRLKEALDRGIKLR